MFSCKRNKIYCLFIVILLLLATGAFFLSSNARASAVDVSVDVTSGAGYCGDGTCNNGETTATCSADCGGGTGCSGDECNPPTALTISGLTAGSITTSTASISWSTNHAATCSLGYGILNYTDHVLTGATSPNPLSGLASSTAYSYKVSCIDSDNSSAESTSTFTTLSGEIAGELIISVLPASAISKNGATINWTTDPASQCALSWGKNIDYSGGSIREITFLSSHSKPLSGLDSETVYHYQLSCETAGGLTAITADHEFKTLLGPDIIPPGPVTNARISSGDANALLFWRNPIDADFAGVVIRRSNASYPSLSQGIQIYDGRGTVSGSERSFSDSGLVNDTIYYYSIFAYDNAPIANFSSGVGLIGQPAKGLIATTTPPFEIPPPPPGGYVGELLFTDFSFSQQGQTLEIIAGNTIEAQPNYLITVTLPQSKAPAGTVKIIMNLTVAGQIQTIIFTYDSGKNIYSAIIPPIAGIGSNFATIVALNDKNETLNTAAGTLLITAPILEVLPSLPQIIDDLANAVAAIRNNPTVKAIAEAAATPAGQGTAAATVALSFASTAFSIPLLNWWFLIQFLFTQPLRLFGFRKGWGTVYNAITKKPVDLVPVRLYDFKTNRLLASRVTDKNGRYVFLVDPGEYYIKIERPGFEYPSVLLKHAANDGNFTDLYYGEKIAITGEERSAIVANIPIDQENMQLTDNELLRRFSRAKLSQSLSWLGPILAVVYFLFVPSIFSLALIVVHLLLLFLFRRLAGRKSTKHWGVVYAPDGKDPIKKAITRVFSSEYGRMLEFYVTDSRGRYNFLVGNNKYFVTADKPGFGTAKTPILDLTGQKTEELAIAQDLILPEEGKAIEPASEISEQMEVPTAEPKIKQKIEEIKSELPVVEKKPETKEDIFG